MRPRDLSEVQIDALKEVGSIGAGHAATALSQLVDKTVHLEMPTFELIPIGEVPHVFGGKEELVGAVYTRLLGDIAGGMLFVAPRATAIALVDMLRSRPVGTTKSFGHEEEATFTHVASVLTSAYLAAIARMADLNLLPSSPAFALDMVGAVLEVVTAEVGMKADTAVLSRSRFCDLEQGVDSYVDAALFFLPDPDSLDVLLGRLGVA